MAENNAMNVRIVDGDDCCPQAMCVKVCNLVQEVRKTGASKKLIPSEKAVSDALKGTWPALISGGAQSLAGVAATVTPFGKKTAAVTGAAQLAKILGNTIVWNQKAKALLDGNYTPTSSASVSFADGKATLTSTTNSSAAKRADMVDFTPISGHKYYIAATADTTNSSTAALVAMRDANNVSEITASVGAGGIGRMSAVGAVSNAVLFCITIQNATPEGDYAIFEDVLCTDLTQAFGAGNEPATAAEFEAILRALYYATNAGTLRSNDAAALQTAAGILPLDLTGITGIPEGGTEDDRVVVFHDGPRKAGAGVDSIEVVNGATVAKVKTKQVDLGDFNYTYYSGNSLFCSPTSAASDGSTDLYDNVCSKYEAATVGWSSMPDKSISRVPYIGSGNILIKDSSFTDANTFKAAMKGEKLIYALANPVTYTDLQYPDGTPFELPQNFAQVAGGDIVVVQPESATAPSAPFAGDIAEPQVVINATTLVNLLDALKTAGVISAYTMTPDGNGNYTFTITA